MDTYWWIMPAGVAMLYASTILYYICRYGSRCSIESEQFEEESI